MYAHAVKEMHTPLKATDSKDSQPYWCSIMYRYIQAMNGYNNSFHFISQL